MNILYFFSKTDTVIIQHCPSSTKAIQLSLGVFVLFTGILAFFSGSFAISNMFIRENENHMPVMIPFGWIYTILLGMLYSAIIMAIDREIVATTTKWAVLLRIPLAIVISLVVAVPIELQIFDGRITKQLRDNGYAERQNQETELEAALIKPVQNKIDSLEKAEREAIIIRDYWNKTAAEEAAGEEKSNMSGKRGAGPIYRIDSANAEKQTLIINEYEHKLAILKTERIAQEAKKTHEIKTNPNPTTYDLLSRYIALKELKINDKTGSATEMGWGITVLFLLFELIPSIMKLLLPKTEYDTMLEKRRLLNINSAKIIYQQTYLDYGGMTTDEIKNHNPIAVEKIYRAQSTNSTLVEAV